MEAITKETLIGEAVQRHPMVAEILLGYGLHCVGCHVNIFESLEDGAKGHGMSEETIENMINDANKVIMPAKEDAKFNISDKAAEKINRFINGENKYLRITVVEGGCAGYKYDYKPVADK